MSRRDTPAEPLQVRWFDNPNPKRLTFNAHGRSVITCLILSHGRIITASDDHTIHVYWLTSGELLYSLQGHAGGVWAIAATRDTLVSGSTDRTVRIWDLSTGRCTHVFAGHTSTIRCIVIVKPEGGNGQGDGTLEMWPKRPLILSGSRDRTSRVWTLPKPGEAEHRSLVNVKNNSFHQRCLEGHTGAVRALVAHGRTAVSGSYDCTVRVWDIISGACTWTLTGHTAKVYAVALDTRRNLVFSGAMDATVRSWNLQTGECTHTLTGHTSLIGLLTLSRSFLVSASADATMRVWDPDGVHLHTLVGHIGAVTCVQHDDAKVLSGSEGTLKIWNIQDGGQVRDLLTGVVCVWQVAFKGQFCVAASNLGGAAVVDVWDFASLEGDGSWADSLDDESEYENEAVV